MGGATGTGETVYILGRGGRTDNSQHGVHYNEGQGRSGPGKFSSLGSMSVPPEAQGEAPAGTANMEAVVPSSARVLGAKCRLEGHGKTVEWEFATNPPYGASTLSTPLLVVALLSFDITGTT